MPKLDSYLSHLPKVLANELSVALREARRIFGDYTLHLSEWRRQRMARIAANGITYERFVEKKDFVSPVFDRRFTQEEDRILEKLAEAFRKLHQYYDDPTEYASKAVITASLVKLDSSEIEKIIGAEIIEKIEREARSSTGKKGGKSRAANNEASKALEKIEADFLAYEKRHLMYVDKSGYTKKFVDLMEVKYPQITRRKSIEDKVSDLKQKKPLE